MVLLSKEELGFLETAKGKDETRPTLMTIHQPKDGIALATDGYRVHIVHKGERIQNVPTVEGYPDVLTILESSKAKDMVQFTINPVYRPYLEKWLDMLAKNPFSSKGNKCFVKMTLKESTGAGETVLVLKTHNFEHGQVNLSITIPTKANEDTGEVVIGVYPKYLRDAIKFGRPITETVVQVPKNGPERPLAVHHGNCEAWVFPVRLKGDA